MAPRAPGTIRDDPDCPQRLPAPSRANLARLEALLTGHLVPRMPSDTLLLWIFAAGALCGLALAALAYSAYQEFWILRYRRRRRQRERTKPHDSV